MPIAEEKYRILLEVAEAANAHLDLAAVLEATFHSLQRFVPFDLIAIARIERSALFPSAAYIAGAERQPGESVVDAVTRGLGITREQVPYGVPLAGSATEEIGRTGKAYVAQDLERERPYAEDEPLYKIGVRAYVRTPLRTAEGLIGSMTFSRMTARAFSAEEVVLLEDVSPPIALAVANSFAYEEIRRLKDRLAAENQVLREEIDRESMFEEIVGSSNALRAVLDRVEKVAATESTVLVTGETGTGKELVARAIHRRSPRADRALIKVNCAALPAGLIASELFGHEKGAFTGALQQRSGRFELANGGSIFLDEVGELPPDVQASLLRVLQEGEFERVGGSRTLRTDVRVIAATNRDLGRAVAEGTFRSDLFYRLNVFPVEMPPLRDRTEDVPVLVEYFTTRFASRMGKRIRAVDRDSMRRLVAYAWPGNVRELQNVIERAAILAEGDVLRIDERELADAERAAPAAAASGGVLRDVERNSIERALAATRGRVSGPAGAAAKLGIPSTTLESKIKRYRIDKFRYRRR